MRLALVSLLALTACNSIPSVPVPTVAVQVQCLPLKDYTLAEQQAAGAALAALQPTNPLVAFMGDYGAMRAADRACMASNTAKPGATK